jgi:hypothetical protein
MLDARRCPAAPAGGPAGLAARLRLHTESVVCFARCHTGGCDSVVLFAAPCFGKHMRWS